MKSQSSATLTVAQTSQLTGLSLPAAYRAIESGPIEIVRFGRGIRVKTRQLFEQLGLLQPLDDIESSD